MALRGFQVKAVDEVRAKFAEHRSVVLSMPTGAGKTHTAAEIIRLAAARGSRVVFAAHLDALIDDTSERLQACAIEHGIVQADRPTNASAAVQVCSLATLHRRGDRPPADLVIVDECHRAMAESVRSVVDSYPTARILGLTATLERGDGKPLGDVFDALVCGPSVAELTALGFLVPAHVLSPATPSDGALAMHPVDAYLTHARGLPAMIFCRDAEHAAEVRDGLALAGVPVALVLGETSRAKRRDARDRLAAGEPLVLVGCGVFVEGWDSPEVRAVVLARAFGVCGGFLQACGRALRPAPGKTHALAVDLSGAALLHGLPDDERVWSLEGEAVRRTGAGLAELTRCRSCSAVFHVGAEACPHCSATTRGIRLPRRATRIERQELARLDERPQSVRDAMAYQAIEKRVRASGRFPPSRVAAIARSIFERRATKRAKPIADGAA
jgi:superfamily II DNA or RNA helicase